MHPDLTFPLSLLVKMLLTAGIVVTASRVAERAGPLLGSLVATLPVSTGPAYVFLSLDHDRAYLAQSALSSFATNTAVALFALAYAATAQRHRMLPSLLAALAAWFAFAFAAQLVEWTVVRAGLVAAIVFALCIVLSRPLRYAPMPPPKRRWYDVPLRAGMVSLLVLLVVILSDRVGPLGTGMLAVYPVVFTSLILILHPRVGGPATAAVIAHGLVGLIGFQLGLGALQLAMLRFDVAVALTIGLAICVGWNLMLFALRRRSAR